jgi:diguanylate cyclase (GGDEF)-like protein
MTVPRRSALGTRFFVTLAIMLVPLALVGAAGLASQYRNASEQSAISAEAVAELTAVARARDALAEGSPVEVAVALRGLRRLLDEEEERAILDTAMRQQRDGVRSSRVRATLASLRRAVLAELGSSAADARRRADRQLAVLLVLLLAGIAVPLAFATRLRLDTSRRDLVHHAFHDALTGLPNRALFADRTEQALKRAHHGRHGGGHVAVLFLDLDDFKGVNDGFGHSAGDELLTTVARRLRDTLRTEDTIARLGGDEFAVLLEHVPDVARAEQAADRLLEALTPPVTIGDRDHLTDASVGIALSAGPDDTAEVLLRNADVAMYAAKGNGRGRREVFAPAMQRAVFARMSLESDLRRGIEREEFRLVYQPVIDLETRRTVAVEALLRWDHPERGLVPPLEFIPTAERSGLIVPIGRWVIEEATREGARLQRLPGAVPNLTVAVNLSPRQLLDRHLVRDVANALEASGIAPGTLVLELTETLLTADVEDTVPVLAALKRLGVMLALDDLGTGYSSLSYLRRFPIDVIKLDRDLVSGSEHDAKLARALIGLGRELDLATVAEGIENPDQLAEMRRLGCDLGQGFLFAHPMPPDELAASLSGELPLSAGSRPSPTR